MTDVRVRSVSPRGLEDALRRLLVEADRDFVPPLSSRTSTVQSLLAPRGDATGTVEPYLTSLLDQHLLVAESALGVLGFASYRPGHTVRVAGHPPLGPVCYLSTIVVARAARGAGVGRRLYRALLAAAESLGEPLATRTWSGNDAHVDLLTSVGLVEVLRLRDDRGRAVDTVYYASTPGAHP